MKKYWFKQRRAGYGFTPSTWEGWACAVVALTLILILGKANNLFTSTMTGNDVFQFFVDFSILAILFIIFIRNRVKGGLRRKSNTKQE